MKNYLNWMPNWLLLPILAMLFCATWPILLIVVGVNSLFSTKSTDSEKVTGAKMAVVTLIGLIVMSVFVVYEHSLTRLFNHTPWLSLFILLIIGLSVLAVLQKIFPNWKFLKRTTDW